MGQPVARGARPPQAVRARGQAAVTARDRAHRAGHGAQQRPAARAAAAVDRSRGAGRGRRRGRRLHLFGVRGRDPARLPQALPRHGRRDRRGHDAPGRAARHGGVRARGGCADRGRGRRAPGGTGDAAGDGHRLRPGLAVRPARPGVAVGRAVRMFHALPRGVGRPARARPRAGRGCAGGERARRRPPGAARAAAGGGAGVRWAAALPGDAGLLAGLRRPVDDRGHRRAGAQDRDRSGRRGCRRGAGLPADDPRDPGRGVLAATDRRAGRGCARRRRADRDRCGDRR